jgi:hypothetical protein
MASANESVLLSLPRSAVADVISMSDSLVERMHALLERNTDGELTDIEQEELETLTRMAQFGQVIALALRAQGKP